MVTQTQNHKNYGRILKISKIPSNQIKSLPMLDLREYLMENFPEVISEMENDFKYRAWIKQGILTYFVDILEYNGKQVGFVAMDVGSGFFSDNNAICIGKAYILKDYRGKGIFPQYLQDLIDYSMSTEYFPIFLNQPNRYTINSLVNAGLLHELPDGLVVGMDVMFVIRCQESNEHQSLSVITPFYDKNLFAPVHFFDETSIAVDKLSVIDMMDFNTLTRKDCLNDEYLSNLWLRTTAFKEASARIFAEQLSKYMDKLGKNTIQKEVDVNDLEDL